MDEKRKDSAASTGGHRRSVGGTQLTSVLGDGEIVFSDRELTADEEVLLALGYKPEFKREFSYGIFPSCRTTTRLAR